MTDWMERARELGFDDAAEISPAKLTARRDVRAMCEENRCGLYGANWTCPPECGDLETCQEKMHGYRRGLLLQTVGQLSRAIDTRGYAETGKRQRENLLALAGELRAVYPDALCLGAGGCPVCEKCAYPEPCRFPDKAIPSMEGYGLFVTQVCRDAELSYYHGPKTITYTACVLFG